MSFVLVIAAFLVGIGVGWLSFAPRADVGKVERAAEADIVKDVVQPVEHLVADATGLHPAKPAVPVTPKASWPMARRPHSDDEDEIGAPIIGVGAVHDLRDAKPTKRPRAIKRHPIGFAIPKATRPK